MNEICNPVSSRPSQVILGAWRDLHLPNFRVRRSLHASTIVDSVEMTKELDNEN